MKNKFVLVIFFLLVLASFFQFFYLPGEKYYPRIRYPGFHRKSDLSKEEILKYRTEYKILLKLTDGKSVSSNKLDGIFEFVPNKEGILFERLKRFDSQDEFPEFDIQDFLTAEYSNRVVQLTFYKNRVSLYNRELVSTDSLEFN